ncbi:MAG TPA: hypothetical protein VE221_03605, partial [Sphingomicrobium sp.]|nr:hypothetical protein [Sphingomicrobium sp.]
MHFFRRVAGAALGIALAAAPLAVAHAAPAPAAVSPAGQSVDDFYRGRSGAPLWLAPSSGDAAGQLLALLGTANLDDLDPGKYHVAALQQAIEAAHKRKDIARADQ